MFRGEIWLTNLQPTLGAEISKTRPSVIVNDDLLGVLPLKVIVPITDWKERYDGRLWMIKIEPNMVNGLTKTSAVDTFQVRSVSQSRLQRKLGQLDETEMEKISAALSIVLKIV